MSDDTLLSSILTVQLRAFTLAVASSTDNFLVGLSLGLSNKPLRRNLLFGISVANAIGCFVATYFGSSLLTPLLGNASHALAGVAFLYLAYREYQETCESAEPKRVSLELAIPMSLNNLAGGVAGGVLGLSATIASLHVLAVSVGTMWIGHWLGSGSRKSTTGISTSQWSILLYAMLSFLSFYESLYSAD